MCRGAAGQRVIGPVGHGPVTAPCLANRPRPPNESSRGRVPRDEGVGGRHRRRSAARAAHRLEYGGGKMSCTFAPVRNKTLRRLIGRAAVVGISDAVAAATRVPDRKVVSRRSGKWAHPGQGRPARLAGGMPIASLLTIPSVQARTPPDGCQFWPGAPGVLPTLASSPGSGRGQGPLVLHLAGTLASDHGNGALVYQRRPAGAVRIRGYIAARRSDRGESPLE
jgi:hypothetical protein